jgi:haloalkane dehalogenase
MLVRSFPDFPYEPRFHDVLGARMAVVDEGNGEGPPLVLLHGNPTWSYLWRKVIPVLAQARRVLAPDLIGHGRSGKPDIGYRLADHIRYFDGLLDGLGLDQVVLVLHDWGGSVGLDWARRHPDRVAGLVLTETRLRVYPSWDDVARAPVSGSASCATRRRAGGSQPWRTCSSATRFPMGSRA